LHAIHLTLISETPVHYVTVHQRVG